MRRTKKPQINVGFMEIPIEYLQFTKEQKNLVCDKIIDEMLIQIDRNLLPEFSRIDFLEEVLESSLISNELEENYEICSVIKDCQRRLNEATD